MTGPLQRPLLLVGCGRMGSAMLAGWLARGTVAGGVWVVEPQGAQDFADRKSVRVVADAAALPPDLDPEVVVLAVKPQQMAAVLPAYKRFASASTLFLSIAAGITIALLERHLGTRAVIVRAMPNTPAAIGQGITVACPNGHVTAAQLAAAKALLSAMGEAVDVSDEDLLDPVTALSGSGPAYVFLLIEAMTDAGVAAGLPRKLAERLALVTVAGSGQLALQGGVSPAQLRENVTSPGGTTAAALGVLMAEDGLPALMKRALAAATERSRQLARGE